MTTWRPARELTPEVLQNTRRPIPVGSDFGVGFGVQPAKGVPAQEMHPLMTGKVSARYLAEFHSGILEELAKHKFDWAQEVTIGGRDIPRSHPLGDAIAQLNFRDLGAKDLMPEHEVFLRSWIYQSFNRDLLLAVDLDATFTITRLFAQMLTRRGLAPDRAGDQALTIVVPNVGGLPWEAVGEFREHPGSKEARSMLREFEAKADQEEPEDAYAWLQSVSQKVTDAYATALAATAKSLPEELGKQLMLGAVGFIPAVGGMAQAMAGAGEALKDHMRERRTWSAALSQLRTAT